MSEPTWRVFRYLVPDSQCDDSGARIYSNVSHAVRVHLMLDANESFGFVEQRDHYAQPPTFHMKVSGVISPFVDVPTLRVGMDMLELMYQNSQKGETL